VDLRQCLHCLPRQSSASGRLPSPFSPSSRAKDNTMSRKTLITLSASMLLSAAIAAPTAALAQFGPPPGPPPMLAGPPPGLGAGGPPLGGPSAGHVASLLPHGGAGAP